jgi:hypothetical protein
MLHTNHCQHPMKDFIESHAGSDIFVYDSDGKQCYCIRHSSEDSDYTSSIRTLEQAREWAETKAVGRFITSEPPAIAR